MCRAEEATGAIVVEVSDRHPGRAPRDGAAEPAHDTPEYGRGLNLVARLAESWGVDLLDSNVSSERSADPRLTIVQGDSCKGAGEARARSGPRNP